ncbi:hypothetical protein ANCDUO_13173 [Ancylostoma duodenale]|uniref:DUF5641 domain-containing protein n=1 Tax=Ancylostoma duodenale TaxID=51022 RepID=A0A0C2GHU7_9BILA|nr:hypothetical protein ANCDUO_13173 [Ancylostoma duodenale]
MSIKYALERDFGNRLKEEILANTYVDNVLIDADSTRECILEQMECKETSLRMNMNLREFMSNNTKVMGIIPAQDRMTDNQQPVKFLGLKWDPHADTLNVPINIRSAHVSSKRSALRDLWQSGHLWDDPLDSETTQKWNQMVQEIVDCKVHVPRFVGHASDNRYDIVVCSDASKRVYAVAVYVITQSAGSKPNSTLIFAKAKLTAPGATTISRMELLACHMAAKTDYSTTERLVIREYYRERIEQLDSLSIKKFRTEQDNDGVIRVRQRMVQAEMEQTSKNPILLVPDHPLTNMIIMRQQGRFYPYPESPDLPAGRLSNTTPSRYEELSNESYKSITSYHADLRKTSDHFWELWQKEYLAALAEKNATRSPRKQAAKREPRVGDVVLIRQENKARSMWPIGLVLELFTSKDRLPRSALLRAGKKNILERSVNQLVPLEVTASDVNNLERRKTSPAPTRIQPPRAVKKLSALARTQQ